MKQPRFIAGAVCPECGAVDRIQIVDTESGQARRCVACGYRDRRAGMQGHRPSTRLEPAGRSEARAHTPMEPVRILDRTIGPDGQEK